MTADSSDSMGADPTARAARYRRSPELEAALSQLNELLSRVEPLNTAEGAQPQWPVIFVVGAPRSGTTLVMQWLAATDLVGYPTNLLARFYRAPRLGARIQRLIADARLDPHGEFADVRALRTGFGSDLGKTAGIFAPAEFWYFWRRFFPAAGADWSHRDGRGELEPAAAFVSELAALEQACGKPWAMKAMIANWNIPFVDALFRRALFIDVRRDPLFNAQSLLLARERFFGAREPWYSFQPPQYEALKALDPIDQVAAQVLLTRDAIDEGLEAVAPHRRMSVEYEAFCADPCGVFQRLRRRLEDEAAPLADAGYRGPASFTSGNAWRLGASERERLTAAVSAFDRSRAC